MTSSPTLVVISGPPGAGKTTLAHELGTAIGCPVVCRDEIKEGLVHATPGFTPGLDDELSRRTLPLFFAVIAQLLEGGSTVIAEAAFQDRLWRPHLEPLRATAMVAVVQCHVDAATARRRIADRDRAAHADHTAVGVGEFDRLRTADPTIDVDTTNGYRPSVADVVAFVESTR